jgi:hypothetical protein
VVPQIERADAAARPVEADLGDGHLVEHRGGSVEDRPPPDPTPASGLRRADRRTTFSLIEESPSLRFDVPRP